MKRRFTILTAALALLTFLAVPMGMRGQSATLVSGSGTSGYSIPDGWTSSGTVEGGSYLKFDNGTITSPEFAPHNGLSFTYSVATFGSGTNHPLTIRILNASTNAVIVETTTATPTSSSYISTDSPISLGDVTVTFKIQMYGPTGKGVRLRNYSVTGTPSGGETPTTYTVSYNANGGTGTMTDSDSPYTAGATVTVLGNEFTRTDYEFDHWNTAADDSGTSYDEADTFTINANTTLYAQWTENTTPTPSGITATLNIQAYAQANNWTNGTKYTTATVAPVTFTANGGGNTGKYYTSGQDWRFYQNESASITITVAEGYTLVSVTPTYSVSNSGVLKNGNTTIASETTVNVSGTSVTFTVGNSGSATNGQVRFTNIDVTYVSNGGTIPPSITANNVEIAYDAEEGIINYTINNPVEGGSIVASCDAEWIEVDDTPQTDAEGSIDFICAPNSNFYAHSATVTLTYTYGDSKATVTKDVTVTQALDPDANGSTIDYPIMVSEAIEAIDEVGSVSNIYVGGIVSEITASTSSYITFKMYDEDGDDYYLQAYHCTGNNFNEVAVGDQVVVYGTLEKYGTSVYQFASGCQLVSLIHPAVPSITVNPDEVNVDATPAAGEDFIEGTLDLTWENLEITDFFEDFAIQYYDAEGEELADDPNWIMVDLATQDPNIGEGYLVSYMIEENEGTEARTAYFKVFALGDEDYVYSNLVTITQAAPVAPVTGDKYVKVTSTDDLTSGQYLIVYEEGSLAFDGGLATLDAVGNTIEVIISNNEIVVNTTTTASEFTIDVTAGTIMSASGYYIGQTSNANGMQTSLETAYTNTISFDESGNANIVSSGGAYLRYNSASNQNRFRYYKSSSYTGQKAIQLYKKVGDEPATETYTLTVDAYTNDNTKDGYNLIASPVNVNPATVAGMTEGDFDLYSFDESQEDEWRNYEATAFNLVPGKGYLYAKKATTENQTYTFELTGIPYNNEPIILSKSESGDFPGWNLVGNPFGETAVLSDNRDFYVMNSDGSDFIQGSGNIAPMQGIFVIAEADDEDLVFTPVGSIGTGPIEDFKLVLNLTKGRGIIDRAVVRFGEGRTLPKFMLNANNTKLYITEGNQDYAVVRSNNAGEMPVSFKAAENGNYTLSIETENVEASYLHLIDNMTGTDVDLLATPSYNFEARTTDNANRFRLVFNANGVEENTMSNFAYFNGSSWTVNNMGEATLQVVDMMGRVISTQTISGNADVNLNQAAGVYMLRLVTGNDVKVQKVVVR